ncbi:Sugar phosphate isomerase/epimerase [Aquimarina amphilecti]|uniref:Sugar phosphate isomerase/epimerase n=1 Tax=Aquimarina amphilecti TaxID=1038014 RepID=A0A1H7QGF0_AQUAM|nr:sugar phosphate isomerase/epimerase family protein [Aquimarina amphilecti]SEL47180.1 Sugar phosphate isomerase/epimerase [Aquimarina amphilecti]
MYKTIFKGLLCLLIISSCKKTTKENTTIEQEEEKIIEEPKESVPFFELSLAQWSLHKEIQSGKLDPMDFAKKAKELGFSGVEYVSQLYSYKDAKDPKLALQQLLDSLKSESNKHNVQNLLIMVDGEGDLAVIDEKERNQTVENHQKWVDAAQFLGCHSIRVNLFGTNDPEKWVKVATDGLTKLSEYAATKSINVIVENHGYLSSNGSLLAEVMRNVNKPNCGTLPDFGNFCLEREGGERWGAKCVKEYPKYKGTEELMPFAKGVSAKSYDFDENGNETTIDYKKMLEIVKASGYQGYIGVEYEGDRLSEIDGIIATRDLLINLSKQLN